MMTAFFLVVMLGSGLVMLIYWTILRDESDQSEMEPEGKGSARRRSLPVTGRYHRGNRALR